ncbi:putative serine/threonine-protein kinase-like protein CCR3 isoform X2 [Castanea sativa]|uniref:putative serine/threonine-protein kinase-like protein CCR3 isoform X2 n=1 Tax=Castanea sativa TaxID=21020 RepID=UPI003F64EE4E
MTKLPSIFLTVILIFLLLSKTHALGSGSTLAVISSSATVCGIIASQPTQRIQCYQRGQVIAVDPNTNFTSISGGTNFLCGLRSGGYSLLCWDPSNNFSSKRLYFNDTVLLHNLAVGDDQVCATFNGTNSVNCWRRNKNFRLPSESDSFSSISSGFGFSCGILNGSQKVRCWGSNTVLSTLIEGDFTNMSMNSIVAGGSHVCGFNSNGFVVCKGDNSSGQLNVPSNSVGDLSKLSLGDSHSCGIKQSNQSVVCWGGRDYSSNVTEGVSFETIVSGSNFTCGLKTGDLSIMCWGPGWPNEDSEKLCSGFGIICSDCNNGSSTQQPVPSPTPSSTSSPSKGLRRGLLAFCIVGSIGGFAGICTVIYCLWTGVCFGKKKVHNSVQPTITRAASSNIGTTSNNSPPSRSSTIRRQGSRIMRRQRSGTSSKHADKAEEFSLAELAAATNNFALENKIGAGSFGVVYRGKLIDGREVAIKRGDTSLIMKKYQEKESAFDSELAFLSRLHHKHLVRLVGFCDEKEERLLVYEFMKNGALYDHLHDKNNVEKSSSVLNSWKMRIKIALDAARGIEYLHNYAVPPIIHRDIKSSNILLDAYWTARVSDFGLSLMGPESDRDYRPMKAAGTVGYIDPEYYGLNVLTAKSDVYGLGVVLLELLTGKRAIFKNGENGGAPISVVDFTVPAIMAGELGKVLDSRVGPPELNEAEAVELMAYTALHCVNLEGRERPTMADIVANLDRALALCDHSHGSISSGTISIVSE